MPHLVLHPKRTKNRADIGMAEPALAAYCINLTTRPDKWKETQATFEGTGLHLERFPGIYNAEGWKGCGASHVAIARLALRHGLPWVLVIEDDCLPSEDFLARWPAVRTALWEDRGSWDIFLGGPTYVQGPIEPRKNGLIEIDQGFALHFYVLNASAYEKALAWNPDRHGPIDVYYSDQYRVVTTHPILAVQRPGVSDIKQEKADYTDHFEETDRVLQSLLYSFDTRYGSLLLFISSVAILVYLASKR